MIEKNRGNEVILEMVEALKNKNFEFPRADCIPKGGGCYSASPPFLFVHKLFHGYPVNGFHDRACTQGHTKRQQNRAYQHSRRRI